ncbi:MAG: 4-hydroxy-3-methylbut-2-enyl diphosphate reductase [Eubacterium sp.]|nr:4-hydroxy-3-methylbut-2-enyl diphosphate reductase [Eubacterium sp.]
MNVITAKTAGFCFGVERAMKILYDRIEQNDFPLYTYGPIIHNETVVKELEEKGVGVLESAEDIAALTEGTVVIRTHGVGPEICGIIESNGLKLVDATCPFVKKIHHIVSEKAAEGYRILIAGDPAHPEVRGIVGWCGNARVDVVGTVEAIEDLDASDDEKICFVSQTTFNAKKFKELVEVCEKKSYTCYVVDTICNATNERQEEARDIASKADVMIVIGGRNSSNTRKLYEICSESCKDTYFVQTLEDFTFRRNGLARTVGITAGASTPNNIIKEVQNYVRRFWTDA